MGYQMPQVRDVEPQQHGHEDPGKGNRKFITLGAGLKFKVATLDFAYLAPLLQNHPLQNTLRFSLSFDFE
jgi:hypothetical protein